MQVTHTWLSFSLYLSFVDLDSWVVLYHPLSLPGLCTSWVRRRTFFKVPKTFTNLSLILNVVLEDFFSSCFKYDVDIKMVELCSLCTFQTLKLIILFPHECGCRSVDDENDEKGLGWRRKCRLTCLKGKLMLECFRIARTEDGFQLIETLNPTWYCRLGFWSIDHDHHDQWWSWWPSIEVSVDKYCQLSFCSLL